MQAPGRYTYYFSLSPDGLECYFTIHDGSWAFFQIMEMRYENGAWSPPAPASFSDRKSMFPFLADDGKTMYFCRDNDIYLARRTANGWSEPEIVPDPVTSPMDDYSCSVSSLGNAWMCSHKPGGKGNCDIWRIEQVAGRFSKAANVSALNSPNSDCSPVTGPGEAFVLWQSNRPGGYGMMDIYASFADGKGGWTEPVNLGPTVNSAANEGPPCISPDGTCLFFSRDERGGANLYWVKLDFALAAARAKSGSR